MTRRRLGMTGRALTTVLVLGIAICIYAAEEESRRLRLPDAAAEAVGAAFPEAAIVGVERARESGVMLYDVRLEQDGKVIGVEVSPDGVIGEIESIVSPQDVPKDIADSIAKATSGGRIVSIERHERRGAIKSGRFVKLEKPKVMYEVRFYRGGKPRRIEVASKESVTSVALPREALAAIHKAFPQATVEEVELQHKLVFALYEIEIRHHGRDMEVKIAPEGTIVEVETSVTTKDLPEAVAIALAKLADGGKVVEIEEQRVYAVAQLVELDPSQTTYEAEIIRDGERLEAQVAADGTVLKTEQEEEDDHEGDDEEEVVFPERAAAAIEKAFPEATVEGVELEHEVGLTLYEVEIRHHGREMEVKVAPDGMIVEAESRVSMTALPAAVVRALAELAEGGKIEEVEEQRVYAIARLVELETPQTAYEAEIVRDGEELQVTFAPDGSVINMEREDDGDDNNDNDNDNDNDEDNDDD